MLELLAWVAVALFVFVVGACCLEVDDAAWKAVYHWHVGDVEAGE